MRLGGGFSSLIRRPALDEVPDGGGEMPPTALRTSRTGDAFAQAPSSATRTRLQGKSSCHRLQDRRARQNQVGEVRPCRAGRRVREAVSTRAARDATSQSSRVIQMTSTMVCGLARQLQVQSGQVVIAPEVR